MNENLLEAREELKRLEHIIYVSLKYTRTVDVINNALNRMVSTYDFIVDAFLDKALEDKKLDSVPKSPALKAKKLAELYPDDPLIQKNLHFYFSLRNILKSAYLKRQEFRRHVTLIDCSHQFSDRVRRCGLIHLFRSLTRVLGAAEHLRPRNIEDLL